MQDDLLHLTASLVTSYVSHNLLRPSEMQGFITDTYATLSGVGNASEITGTAPVVQYLNGGNGQVSTLDHEVDQVEQAAIPEPTEEVNVAPEPVPAPIPAVDAKESVFPDHLVCMCCGKEVTMLKRHLMTHHSLTVDEYRAKWGLPSDYPMVAPNYSEKRSGLAKAAGFGQKR